MHQHIALRLCCLGLLATSLWGQAFTATVRGTVTDGSGAAIPGAQVVVVEADRNIQHPTATDAQGRYNVTALPPGNYTLSVEAPGFRKFAQSSFPLTVAQQATIDIEMQVGDVGATIEVTASAPLLNTTISALGQTFENQFIVNMPNIGRNALNLVYLTPGVVGSAGRRGDNSTNFVANGSRNSTPDVLVDGATVTTVEQNSGITDLKYSPSVDAVQEFKMQTNFFSAEYGQTGTAVVNVVTKSGTNQFHGTGFYFLRDGSFNANNWFANRAGNARPDYRRNQYGGVLGGPVIRNKTFFFVSYEGTREKSPTTETMTVPTLLQCQGDFSQTFDGQGRLIQIFNPFDTYVVNGVTKRRPFEGNRIPTSLMDPVALKAMSYYPVPNQVTNAITNTNNWFGQGVNTNNSWKADFKGDHNFTDSTRLTGRYSYAPNTATPVNLFGEGNPAYTFNNGPNGTKTTSAVVDFTHVQNASTIWTVRYGLIYSDFYRNPMVEGFDLTSLGLPAYMAENAVFPVFPRFNPEGYTDIGTEGWVIMDRQEAVHQISGSVSKTLSGHNLKIGAETRNNFLDYLQPGYPSGSFTFNRQVTSEDLAAGNNLQGNSVASMLLGWGSGSDFHIDPKVFSRSRYWGFYAQDDWKITSKLTLNLGLRYEFDIPRWETQNRLSYFDLDAPSPINGKVPGYDLRGAFKFVDDDTRSPFDADMNNFSPRIGFAYALTPKTAIRGGAGLMYSLSRATVFGHTGQGFNTNAQVVWTDNSNATRLPGLSLSNPYVGGMLTPPGNSLGDATFLGLGVNTPIRYNRNPEYYSWNLSIQQEVGWNSVVEINYTGNRGVHLLIGNTRVSNLDPAYWSLGRTYLQEQVPNPFYNVITDSRSVLSRPTIQRFRLLKQFPQYDNLDISEPNAADSIYHGLQLKWEKRFSAGFTGLAHYTWSKMIDNASVSAGNTTWLGGTTSLQNPYNISAERSLSAHDIPHRLVISGTYQLPFGRNRAIGGGMNRLWDAIVGRWEVSGFLTMQAGVPLQVTQDAGTLWQGTQRPNLIGDPSTEGRIQDRLNQWYNLAAFSRPAADTFGSASRYLNYRGPGIRMLDAALLKSWATKEGQRAEFRLEAQNATNTPQFADPNNNAFGNAAFGQITGLRNGTGPRNVQLGFKYYF